MANKREEEVKAGLPAWMGTYGDMVTLLLCFFVLLFSMSSVDVRKFKETIAVFKDQIDVLPGGEALTEGDRINNGVTQMTDIEILVERALESTEGEEDSKAASDTEVLTPEQLEALAKQKAESVFENVNEFLEEEGVRDDVDVKYSLNYVKITLPGEALFDSARADIKPNAYPIISVIGDMVAEGEFEDYMIQIEGHTDNLPINTLQFPSNWELSASRAIGVGKYLIDEKGIDKKKISCTGYGEYWPIASNDTSEDRAANRRVEVKIVLQTEEIQVEEYDEISPPAQEDTN